MIMEKYEIAELLGIAAALDQRTVGESDVESWHLVLHAHLGGDLPAQDARYAVVSHYGKHTERLRPAHVVEFVKLLRRARLEHIRPAYPPELADENGRPASPQAFDEWTRWRAEAFRLIQLGQYQPDPPMPTLLRAIERLPEEPQQPHSVAPSELWPAPGGWEFPAIPVGEIPPPPPPLSDAEKAAIMDRAAGSLAHTTAALPAVAPAMGAAADGLSSLGASRRVAEVERRADRG
jgi:hypothetical protein